MISFVIFIIGLFCGWFLCYFDKKLDGEAYQLMHNIILELEGYLKSKPLLNERERAFLQKIGILRDQD